MDFEEGTKTRAHVHCPKCKHSQPIRFGREATSIWKHARECGGFVWETNEITKPKGVWNYAELANTVSFECENKECRHKIANSEKYDLIRTMHTHDYNPDAQEGYASFSGCAFEAIWESCAWDKLVIEFLKAVEQAKNGNIEPLKAFTTETLGEPWEDRLGIIENAGFLEARKMEYSYGDFWPEAKRRFIAADVQERGGVHFPYVIREYGQFGKSRLVVEGECRTFAELQKVREDFKIGPTSALIDSGFKAQEIYRFCVSAGWKAFKGEARDYFLVAKPNPKNPALKITARQIWNKTVAAVYNPQTRARIAQIPLYMHCNDATNDLLAEYMMGLVGEWTLPKETTKDYITQMVGDVRREVKDMRGVTNYKWFTVGPNHKRDCERMILVAAIITGVLVAPEPPKKTEDKKSQAIS
jgi:phage terminase large subunit GpA-like protein